MQTDKDIIGIVKELQALLGQMEPANTSWHFGRMSKEWVDAFTKLQQSFPAIAQALLIAVEALESAERVAFDKGINPAYHDRTLAKLKQEWPALYKWLLIVCPQALSRIRSLS